MNFNEFNEYSLKTRPLTVRELFAKQLLQLHSITPEKAFAIVDAFSTPNKFMKIVHSKNCKEIEELISKIKFGPTKRFVCSRYMSFIPYFFFIFHRCIGKSIATQLRIIYTHRSG